MKVTRQGDLGRNLPRYKSSCGFCGVEIEYTDLIEREVNVDRDMGGKFIGCVTDGCSGIIRLFACTDEVGFVPIGQQRQADQMLTHKPDGTERFPPGARKHRMLSQPTGDMGPMITVRMSVQSIDLMAELLQQIEKMLGGSGPDSLDDFVAWYDEKFHEVTGNGEDVVEHTVQNLMYAVKTYRGEI